MMHKKLTIADLKFLKNIYRVNWPKYLPTFALFEHYIERFDKYPEWHEKVIFLTVNEESLKCGTFLMVYRNHIVKFNSLETAPYKNLEKLLNDLDFSEDKMLFAIELHHVSVVEKIVKLQNLEITSNVFLNCGLLHFQPDAIASLMKEFAEPPQGFYYDSLKQSDVPKLLATSQLNQRSWYFEDIVKYNLTLGLYTNDGKLVAYTTVRDGDESGMLYVDANFRRNKAAVAVVVKMSAKLLEMGKPIFGHASVDNEAATRFFKSVAHMEIIGNHRIIALRKNGKYVAKSQL